MSLMKYPNPFAMGNLDDLFNARMNDDVEYLKEWSKHAVKEYEIMRNIQMKAFERLITLKEDSDKYTHDISGRLNEHYHVTLGTKIKEERK